MTYLKNLTVAGAAVAFTAFAPMAFAEDDLDELLNDVAAAPADASAAADGAAEAVAGELAEEAAPTEAPAEAVVLSVPVEQPVEAASGDDDAELIANIRANEVIRRQAYDEQAQREIRSARAAMSAEDYTASSRHYELALKLLNDSPATAGFRQECESGVAESLYRQALKDWGADRRDSAMELMQKAIQARHPKARKQLEIWKASLNDADRTVDVAEISHVRNEKDFKTKRESNRRHLKRARQLLAVRDIDGALEECEIVLVKDPYNEEAIRLRRQIVKKQQHVGSHEQEVAREGMISEVARKWRPVYAANVRDIDEVGSTTVRKTQDEDSERALEQSIKRRMKEMILPTISFKPPMTIIDAVEFFRGVSKDLDDPAKPIEKRGFNFVLKNQKPLRSQASTAADDANDFSSSAGDDIQDQAGVPVISMISANEISLFDALKLVCDSVDYKFQVQGSVVMVMHRSISIDEMVTRSYPVMSGFDAKMSSISDDMKGMRNNGSSGFGSNSSRSSAGDDEAGETDWKQVFSELGVQWPEGSSIYLMKGTGKLRVKNTYENLAELEKALVELNAEQKLIEIETRFVEVCQEDLNSLGFEWILNSDYTIGGGWLANKLGLGKAAFNEIGNKTTSRTQVTTDGGVTVQDATTTTINGTGQTKWSQYDMYGNRTQKGIAGLNAFGGTSDYGNGSRYLSTEGNHISGQGQSTNDRFMKIDAFLGTADLSMILHMLSQRSDTDLLSAPKVLTRPGEEAVIKVVTEYIYPTDYDVQLQSSSGSSGGYGGGGGSSMILAVVEPQSFTMREVGVILDVTPTLTDDGNLIDLKLNTQVVDEPTWKNYGMKIPFSGNSSQLTDFTGIGEIFTSLSTLITSLGATMTAETKDTIIDAATASAMSAMGNLSSGQKPEYYDAPMEQPFFHTRSIDTSVSVYPGATIVMGGLITEERKAMDDKVPFLGDLPFVGRLFRSHSEWTKKKNLLIFVTTRLVDVRGREVTIGSGDIKDAADVKAAPEVED